MDNVWLELLGYLGTVLVIVSMLMTSLVRLRVINVIGGTVSTIYALLINAIPMVVMNACLISINLYKLYRQLSSRQQYHIVKSTAADALVQHFLACNSKDITASCPGFSAQDSLEAVVYVVCAGSDPVGILLGTQAGNTMQVLLDYAVPARQDRSIGGYLYKNLPSFGVTKLITAQNAVPSREKYLAKMGFEKADGKLVKHLDT